MSHFCFDLANYLGLPVVYKKTAFEKNIGHEMKKYDRSLLISLNSSLSGLDDLPEFKGFHLIRDPRDICVSGYYSHLNSHGLDGFDRLGPHREALKKCSKEEGLFLEFEFSKLWLDHMKNWDYENENIIEIKMEELFKDPYSQWSSILIFLGFQIKDSNDSGFVLGKINHLAKKMGVNELIKMESISKGFLVKLIEKYSFKSLSKGRGKGEEDKQSHYRKGTEGDWVNHFSEEHKNVFKELYGDLLIKLGYEKDQDW